MLTERQLLDAIRSIEVIVASDADWEFKYDRVFHIHANEIYPLLGKLGIDFDWYDPDMDYRDDVLAYAGALEDLKKNLEAVLLADRQRCDAEAAES